MVMEHSLGLSGYLLSFPFAPSAALQAAPVISTVSLLLWKLFPSSFLQAQLTSVVALGDSEVLALCLLWGHSTISRFGLRKHKPRLGQMGHFKSPGPPCLHGSRLSWCPGHTFCCGMNVTESNTRAELLTSSYSIGEKLPLYHIRKNHHLLLWFYSTYSSHSSWRPPLYSWQVPLGFHPILQGSPFPSVLASLSSVREVLCLSQQNSWFCVHWRFYRCFYLSSPVVFCSSRPSAQMLYKILNNTNLRTTNLQSSFKSDKTKPWQQQNPAPPQVSCTKRQSLEQNWYQFILPSVKSLRDFWKFNVSSFSHFSLPLKAYT